MLWQARHKDLPKSYYNITFLCAYVYKIRCGTPRYLHIKSLWVHTHDNGFITDKNKLLKTLPYVQVC